MSNQKPRTIDEQTEPFAKEYIAEHPNWDSESMEGDNPDAWMILEVATFGTLSKMYKNLKSQLPERAAIANDFGLYSAKELSSWLEAISVLRNIIAHHSRLWNRSLAKQPMNIKGYRDICFSLQGIFVVCISSTSHLLLASRR